MKKKALIVCAMLCMSIAFFGCLKPKSPDNIVPNSDQNKKNDQNKGIDVNKQIDLNKPKEDENKDKKQQIIDINLDKYPGVPVEVVRNIEKCNAGPPLDAEICLINAASSNKSEFPCTLISEEFKSRCFFEAGVAMSDYNVCMRITDPYLKDDCYNSIGKSLKNSKICKYIEDMTKKDDCYNGIGTFDTCKNIFEPKRRDQCYKGIAASSNDADICLKVSDTYKILEVNARDDCLKQINLANAGEKCNYFVDKTLSAECFKNAANVPDTNFSCNIVKDENAFDYCSAWYASKRGDVIGCYNLKYELKNSCIRYIADNLYGESTCPLINELKIRNECYFSYAFDFNSIERCIKIDGNTELKDKCIFETAKKLKNEDLCIGISKINLSLLEKCISDIALDTKDSRKCEKIQRDSPYVDCYAKIALDAKVPEVCDKVQRKEMKSLKYSGTEQCYNRYAVAMKDDKYCLPIQRSLFVKECQQNVKVALTCVNDDKKCDPRVCTYKLDPNSWYNTDTDCTQEIVEKYVKQGIVPFDLE